MKPRTNQAALIEHLEDDNARLRARLALADKLLRDLDAERAHAARLRATLEPFGSISLVRDAHAAGPDMIDAPDLSVTPADVRRARIAISTAPTAALDAVRQAQASLASLYDGQPHVRQSLADLARIFGEPKALGKYT